jgi:hypothetical protein
VSKATGTVRARLGAKDRESRARDRSNVVTLRVRPAPGSSAQEIADFYLEQDRGRVALIGVYVVPFAGIAFL